MADDARTRLDALRTELGQIDRDILALVARRQAVAQKIGQIKRDAGIPTRDYRQERDVVERARAAAVEHGLSPQLGEELILALIRGSLTVQEKDTVASTGEGSGRRVLVIGGCGHMGRWFVRYLGAQGFTVEVADPVGTAPAGDRRTTATGARVHARPRADRDRRADARDRARSSTAMAAAPPRGVVFDVGSLKSPLRAGLHALRAAGGQVTLGAPDVRPRHRAAQRPPRDLRRRRRARRRPPRRARCSSRRWRRWSRWTSRATIG